MNTEIVLLIIILAIVVVLLVGVRRIYILEQIIRERLPLAKAKKKRR